VPRQRSLGGLGEVEDVVGHLAHRGPAFPLPAVLLELGVIQDLHRLVDLGAKLVGRRAGPGPLGAGQHDGE